MKILSMFPLFSDALPAELSYDSLKVDDVDLYCIADNPKPEIIELIQRREIPINEWNANDGFATGCWNQTYEYFMEHPEYDCLRVGFTDVVMQQGWKEILEANWDEDQAILPRFTGSLETLRTVNRDPIVGNKSVRTEGTPADCVFLSRKLVELTFPVPEEIKLWYNDEYIFTIMRSLGYETVVLDNLNAFHYGSLILTGTYGSESSARIEIDKKNWQEKIKDQMLERIKDAHNRGLGKVSQ